jgi:hypothetical protein
MLRLHRTVQATLLLTVCVAAEPARAGFIATYTFTGAAGDQATHSVDSQPTGATLAALSRGSSLTAVSGANSFNSSGFTTSATPDLIGGFFQFAITPDPDYIMTLSELAFSERRSSTGVGSFELRTSLDSFATSIFLFDVPDNTANRRHTIALPTSFQNLTSSVTFRLYGYDAEATSGTWRLGISSGDANSGIPANLSLSGDLVLTPEPTSLTLFGVGSLLVIGGRIWRSRCRMLPAR